MDAKRFFYASAGICLLFASFQIGTSRVAAQKQDERFIHSYIQAYASAQLSVAFDILYANGLMTKADFVESMIARMDAHYADQREVIIPIRRKHNPNAEGELELEMAFWENMKGGMREQERAGEAQWRSRAPASQNQGFVRGAR